MFSYLLYICAVYLRDIKKKNGFNFRMSYTPYTSNSSTSDSESDSDSDEEFQDMRREQDPRYAILRTPASTSQIKTDLSKAPGAPWDATTNITSLENKVYASAPKTVKTSLFSMKSINRDKRIYPTPYNFQIKLPRIYKNITKFQLVQLSFPNSSNGVTGQPLLLSTIVQDMIKNGIPSSCISSCISIVNCSAATNTVAMMEMGRMNGAGMDLLTTVTVPTGSYNDNQLADELTFQANSTPPFNLISYPAFKDTFQNTRDISMLFNEPGDSFYSKTGRRLLRPNKDAIMSTYYTQQHIDSLDSITDKIAFTAYYYPVLKELVATGMAAPFLQPNYDEIITRVNGIFEGLDSEFYYQTCLTFQGALDTFRKQLTFEIRPVNHYAWKFNEKESRFITMHDKLHMSIQRDLTKNCQTVTQREFALASLNANSFCALKNAAIGYSAIYKHLETNLSSVLGMYTLNGGYQYAGGDVHTTTTSIYTADALHGDEQFSGMFEYRSTIGGIYGNYGGIVMNFRNFMDYHSTLSTYYSIVHSTNLVISGVNRAISMNHHAYVSTKYTGILPQNMIDTKAYTSYQGIPVSFVTSNGAYVPGVPPIATAASASPVRNTSNPFAFTTMANAASTEESTSDSGVFLSDIPMSNVPVTLREIINPCESICCTYINNLITQWYSGLPTNMVIGTLNYRLGLLNVQANHYNIVSTINQYTSTGNLNFLMQINDQQGFNNMDIAMNENYALTHDTTGQIKLVAAKILMSNIGDSGISQTLIQNPCIFENTLGKLDRLNIKIYYDDANITPAWLYLPIDYDINEWNATFQIDEEVGFINQDPNWSNVPNVPIPKNPNDTSYLHFVEKEKK
jgi:hypothetical protein